MSSDSLPSTAPDEATKHIPNRQDSLESSMDSTISNMQGTDTVGPGIPTFYSIFQDAAKYGDVMSEEPEDGLLDDLSDDDATRASISDKSIADSMAHSETDTLADELQPDNVGPKFRYNADFNASIARLAQLSVTNFNLGASVTGLDGSLASSSGSHDTTPEASSSEKKAISDEVIKIFVDEFGPLAEEGEEEKLISEADGAYFQEIAILGIIHLTTHRLTFHASLLATRPDMLRSSHVIKAGPVIIHREGLKRKRRVWLELGPDMMSTFPDSTDEARVRPIRTVLLSAVKEIQPIDPSEPKSIRMVFETSWGKNGAHIEFDDTESALSWRREITGAVYLYNRKRRYVLEKDNEDGEGQGVRVAIPLHRINSFDTRSWASFATVVSFNLTSHKPEESHPVWRKHESMADVAARTSMPLAPMLDMGSGSSGTSHDTISLGLLQKITGSTLETAIEEAKKRRVVKPATHEYADQVVVDFGELAFADKVEADKSEGSEIVAAENPIVDIHTVEGHARRYFALHHDEDVWCARASIGRLTSCSGFIVISPRFVCFWSKGLVCDTKLRFAAHEVTEARRPNPIAKKPTGCVVASALFGGFGLILQVRGHKDMYFEVKSDDLRTEIINRINKSATDARKGIALAEAEEKVRAQRALHRIPTKDGYASSASQSAESLDPPSTPRTPTLGSVQEVLERAKARNIPKELVPYFPKTINLPATTLYHIEPQHFACLTIGSRGDVQPYIALCLGLKKEGHEVTIVTHEEYKAWVEGFGIQHITAGGDPGALMKLSVEHKMFSPQFFKESLGHFRQWLDELLVDSYYAVKKSGATVLIESPSAMAGVHIAEALKIPYFRAFTMPWTRTVEFPHAFITPPDFVAGSFNFSTYVLFDNVFWRATATQINRWRKRTLRLPSTDLEQLAQAKIPFLYNFSPSVVPKPLDWSDTTILTGYWFLDNPEIGWEAPDSLLAFMKKAREDGKPLVYIGFGSIVVEHPKAMTRSIVKAVLKSDVRAILSKGWSARMAALEDEPDVPLPPEIYSVDKIPHDWLFPQIDAALHHGGAGTTGASLRAGIPTLIKPWFGDQFFWSVRVTKLGAGLRVQSLASSDLAHALSKATSDRIIKEKARAVGEKIRTEDGVRSAISALYTYLHRAGQSRTSKSDIPALPVECPVGSLLKGSESVL